MTAVGRALKKFRNDRNLTQAQLAAKVRSSGQTRPGKSQISKLERGERPLTDHMGRVLTQVMDLTKDERDELAAARRGDLPTDDMAALAAEIAALRAKIDDQQDQINKLVMISAERSDRISGRLDQVTAALNDLISRLGR
ncbi:MAG: helix-turn-helix transcriptional regulator [Acidimicrobiaceae bacterium]|nr:helix-turn-helix transcriptional regulator [Acidimicrobiaceae bacterium]